MSSSTLFRHQCIDESGLVPGALYSFRRGRAPGVIYADKDMKIPARNPLPANGRGVAIAYLPIGEEFEVTVTRPDGSHVEQFNHMATPLGGEVQIIEQPAPEPEIVYVDREVEVRVKDPETEAQARAAEAALTDALEQLKAAKAKVDERKPEPVSDEPPKAIADLFDPNLTARQNQEALQKKYAALMSEREHELTAGNSSEAMALLKRAERFESGITWNRARLAEVI